MTQIGVQGVPRMLLRLESLIVLVGALLAYRFLNASWLVFAALFLVPDLTFAGFLAGPKIGSICYNAVHTYMGPLLLLGVSFATPELQRYALIWLAHVALDRALGYGLKYGTAFGDTHLGRIGSAAKPADQTASGA